MRLKDLQTDVAYATCDGIRVTVLDNERADYVAVYKKDSKGQKIIGANGAYEYEVVPFETPDPWGPCHPGSPRQDRVGSDKGVKCERWAVDRDGEVLADVVPRVCIVRQSDIKGLWTEYLVLHGEAVRAKADVVTEQAAFDAWSKSMHQRMRAVFDGFSSARISTSCHRDTSRFFSTSDEKEHVYFGLDFDGPLKDSNTREACEAFVTELEAFVSVAPAKKVTAKAKTVKAAAKRPVKS